MIGWTREVIELTNLALVRFTDLTESELKVLAAVTTGEMAYGGPSRDDKHPHNNPDYADYWGPERDIRAELIRWLCVDRAAANWVDPRGIFIHAAQIGEELDLSFAAVRFPLALLRCRIAAAMNLLSTQMEFLALSGSVVPGFVADGLSVRGNMHLRNGFRADGEVRLLGADIGGNLDCDNGKFVKPNGYALIAAGARVGGTLFLRNGFSAEGEVRLAGADIGGTLDSDGGKFVNPDGYALTADGLKVKGSIFVRNGFSAEGEVRLLGANIGGNLECNGGKFVKPDGDALNAAGAKVGGYVYLHDGFSAEGEVNLLGADIGTDLVCSGGKFTKPDGNALTADRVKVKGGVFLRNGFSAEGEVRLLGADIGGLLDCSAGKFVNPDGKALSADGVKVTGSVFLRSGFSAEGEVRLVGASIGGNLECDGGKCVNPDGNALNADRLKAGGNVFLRNGFSAEGEVRLLGADIGGDLICGGGKFVKPDGDALNAGGAIVGGSVFLRDGFRAEGKVRLAVAEIGNNLEVIRAKFAVGSCLDAQLATVKGGLIWRELGPDVKASLDLRHASVGLIADDQDSWPTSGNLNLDGFVYTRIGAGPTDAAPRLKWLHLQNTKEPSWPRRAIHGALYGGHPLTWSQKDWPQFTPQPYQQLAKVLRDAGDNVGARRVLVAMENSRRKYGDLNLRSWFWRWVLRLTIGYGYKPGRALWCALGVVMLGLFLFGFGYRDGAITPTDKDAYKLFETDGPTKRSDDPLWYYQKFSAPVYSLDTFLPIIDFGQKDRWMPNPHNGTQITGGGLTTGWFLRIYLWFQIAAGWLLTTLFAAGFTSVVRNG